MDFIDENRLEKYIGGLRSETPMIKNCDVVGDNIFKKTLALKVKVPPAILGPNFRELLANLFIEKYENKVLYLFYIIKIDTSPIYKHVLPLIPANSYNITINLDTEIYTIQKNNIVEVSIVVYNYDNKPTVKGQNKYINCSIIPSSEYKVVQKLNKYEIIFENGKILAERDTAFVRINDVLSSNECQTEFIICEGEFYLNDHE